MVQVIPNRRQAEKRLILLQQMTAALAAAVTPDAVIEHIIKDGTAALGAIAGSVVMVSEDGEYLDVLRSTGYSPEVIAAWNRFPVNHPSAPLAVAVRTGKPVWLASPAERQKLMNLEQELTDSTAHRAWAALPLVIQDRVIGAMGFSFPSPKTFDEGERAFVLALAQQCAHAIERARLYAAEQEARQKAERTADQLARLQSLAGALAEAFSLSQVAEVLTYQSAVAVGANASVVNLFHENTQELEIISSRGFDDSLLQRFQRTPLAAPGATPLAAQTRQAVWFHSRAEYLARFPELAAVPERQNAEAIAALPLMYQGRLHGVLGLYFSEPREFAADNREFLLTIARQCAIALERAQLYEAEQYARQKAERTAAWLTRLQFVTAALSQALTIQEVARIIIDSGMSVLGAINGTVNLLLDEKTFEVVYSNGSRLSTEEMEIWQRFPATPGIPSADALRSGQPIWLENTEERVARYPVLAELSKVYPGAWAFLPLRIREREIGVAGFIFSHNRPFAPEEREFMLTLAHYCSQAMERARLIEETRELGAAEERQRLARELHDAVTQTLFSASLMADTLPSLMDRNLDQAKERVYQLLHLNRAALAEMRTLLLELRPEQVVRTPLSDLLTQLVQAVKGRKAMELSLAIEETAPLPSDLHVAFYRIAQEALNNVVKHSLATQGLVYLNSTPTQAQLRIRDNGRGFDPASHSSGLGLGSMRERAEAVGADVKITSESGQGTEICVSWINVIPNPPETPVQEN